MSSYRGIIGSAAILAAMAMACGSEMLGSGGEGGPPKGTAEGGLAEAGSEGGLVEASSEGGLVEAGSEGGLVEASSETGLVDVTCASVATDLCKLAAACTAKMPGGICVVVANRVQLCFDSIAACEETFTSCASAPGGTPGVVPDPGACDVALAGGLCSKVGLDMEFTLPASCATCSSGAPGLCPMILDAGAP